MLISICLISLSLMHFWTFLKHKTLSQKWMCVEQFQLPEISVETEAASLQGWELWGAAHWGLQEKLVGATSAQHFTEADSYSFCASPFIHFRTGITNSTSSTPTAGLNSPLFNRACQKPGHVFFKTLFAFKFEILWQVVTFTQSLKNLHGKLQNITPFWWRRAGCCVMGKVSCLL